MIEYDLLIPAYNSSKTLPILLEKINLLQRPPLKIYIVDDGSSDNTTELLQKFDIELISNKFNSGKGCSLNKGFKQFLERGSADFLLCMDADLQHPAASVPDFLHRADMNHEKIIIGRRRKLRAVMPFLRILSNLLSSFVLSAVTGKKIEDSQCGFRLIHRSVLEKLELKERGFQFETEFILEAAKQNFSFEFVSIPTIYNGSNSYINHIGDTFTFIKLVLRYLFSWK